MLFCHDLTHSVLIVVYFKLYGLLASEIANCEFFVVTLDLHKYEQKFAALNRFCKLFELS